MLPPSEWETYQTHIPWRSKAVLLRLPPGSTWPAPPVSAAADAGTEQRGGHKSDARCAGSQRRSRWREAPFLPEERGHNWSQHGSDEMHAPDCSNLPQDPVRRRPRCKCAAAAPGCRRRPPPAARARRPLPGGTGAGLDGADGAAGGAGATGSAAGRAAGGSALSLPRVSRAGQDGARLLCLGGRRAHRRLGLVVVDGDGEAAGAGISARHGEAPAARTSSWSRSSPKPPASPPAATNGGSCRATAAGCGRRCAQSLPRPRRRRLPAPPRPRGRLHRRRRRPRHQRPARPQGRRPHLRRRPQRLHRRLPPGAARKGRARRPSSRSAR